MKSPKKGNELHTKLSISLVNRKRKIYVGYLNQPEFPNKLPEIQIGSLQARKIQTASLTSAEETGTMPKLLMHDWRPAVFG